MDPTGHELVEGLKRTRLLAIVRGTDESASIRAAVALLDEGFRYLEVSLNTPGALRVIGSLLADSPRGAQIGAGTVLTRDDVLRVRDAGAGYAVTPALAASVGECARTGLPVLAGALTPSECIAAIEQGAAAVKLFPASLGGPGYIRAVREPLPRVPLVAVGGIDVAAIADYLAAGAVAVGLGGSLLGDAAEAGGNVGALRDRARRFLEAAQEESR